MKVFEKFLQKLTRTGKPNNSAEPSIEFKATAVLAYAKGLSEQLRRCLQQQGVRAVFKSQTTKVYLSWTLLLHALGQRGNSHKT